MIERVGKPNAQEDAPCPEIWQIIIDEILEERIEPRRHRRVHRGVKRKMSNYELANRKLDRVWPDDPAKLIAIIRPGSKEGVLKRTA